MVKELSGSKLKRMWKIPAGVLLLLIGLVAGGRALAQEEGRPEVVVLEASGPVVPPLSNYIERGLQKADERNAEVVILVLDTPGGNVNVTLEIIQAIRTSDIPVVVYVGPRGARAASAGLLITLAGHAAAMAPDTAIGASSPVGPQGQDLDQTAQEKAEEYLSAEARSLAERRGEEAVAVANAAVQEARAVSAREALDAGLVDFIAEDVNDLLDQLDGTEVEVGGRPRTLHTRNAILIPIPMSEVERALLILTDPNIVFLLLSIGITAIIVEIRSPGGWVAGTVGTICLGLALYGLGVLPVNWLGLVFIVLAFVLFILEIKAPTHGALAAAAIISMIAGAIILFSQPELAPFGHLSIPLVVGQSLAIGAIFVFLLTMAIRAQSLPPTTGYEGLIGQRGRVTRDLDPRGMVLVRGEYWQAESLSGEPVPAGSEVEVVRAERMRLWVRPVAGTLSPEDRAR
ncbi:MAG TPA: nodulation protein NfeD [Chloroflexi bacterium]|nr:nodulation protein NfeD [Chloroflexota bacterium]